MRRIMLATDFSERSDRALRRATILARQHSAELSIVHVVDNDRPQHIVDHDAEGARLILAQLERSMRDQDGCICTTSVLLDDPFSGIAGAAEEISPDLLVIGPHRRQIFRDAFVGTTAERTIKAVSCPVLMVNGPPVGPWRQILLTTDLSKSAEQALNRFAAMGLGVDAGSSIVNVFDTPALRMIMPNNMAKEEENHYLNAQRELALKELRQFTKNSSFKRTKLIVRREESTVAREILRTAADLPADLVVIASGSKSAIAQLILGSVAQDVLRHAAVDVLIVPLGRPLETNETITDPAPRRQSGHVPAKLTPRLNREVRGSTMPRPRIAYTPLTTYPESASDEAVRAAISYASSLSSAVHVTTFAVKIPRMASPLAGLLLDVPGLVRATEEKCRADCRRLEALAQEATRPPAALDLKHREVAMGAVFDSAAQEARYYDFSVLPWSADSITVQDMTQAVVFSSGRPTIVVPPVVRLDAVEHLAIAWDGSRVAARALGDALGILPDGICISVITVQDEKPLAGPSIAQTLALALSKRGFVAQALPVMLGSRSISQALQEEAIEAGATMLAMGGFGHSRIRDFILGGATKGVFADIRLPVLISH